jgi:hypothetical protein
MFPGHGPFSGVDIVSTTLLAQQEEPELFDRRFLSLLLPYMTTKRESTSDTFQT